MSEKDFVHEHANYASPSHLESGESTLRKDFSPTASKLPQLIAGIQPVKAVLIFHAILFTAAWFGISVLALLLLLHFKDARRRLLHFKDARRRIVECSNVSRHSAKFSFSSRVTHMGVPRDGKHGLPPLKRPQESEILYKPDRMTSLSSSAKPAISTVSSVLPVSSVSAPAKTAFHSLGPVESSDEGPPCIENEADAALVVYSPVSLLPEDRSLGPATSQLVRRVIPAVKSGEPENAALQRSSSRDLVGPMQTLVLSGSADLLEEEPVIEEPVTPSISMGFASEESTGDLTVVYLEDGPVVIERRGLMLDFVEPQLIVSASHAEMESFRAQLLSDLCSTAFSPHQSREETQGTRNHRRNFSTTQIPDHTSRVIRGRTRTQSCAGEAIGVDTDMTNDTTNPTETSAKAKGKQRAVYKTPSWDLTQDDSAEIQRKYMKHVARRTRANLARQYSSDAV